MRLPQSLSPRRPAPTAGVTLRVLLLLFVLLLSACASAGKAANALDGAQYAWSGAIRWGDFTGAANLVDPAVREADPLTDLELERYEQVQITRYRDLGASRDVEAGTAVRDIEIGVVNRHTMAERAVRYRETWRWDPEAQAWWITSGLPDLWDGD